MRLAWSADKAETTPLALQMGPGADEPGALVRKCGKLNLQNALSRTCTIGENLEDQACPIEYLDLPLPLKIALLYRRDGTVDQDKFDLFRLEPCAERIDLARSE